MAHEQQPLFDAPKSATYEIVFDGGSLGNPGKGYGSYEITGNGAVVRHQRHDYGDGVTNNQAEYQTLIEALDWLRQELGPAAASAKVIVNGDSLLVLNQLLGKWKVKNEGLRPLHQRASVLIKQFKSVTLTWHDRSKSVARLGH
jgi:ribonuclease HI